MIFKYIITKTGAILFNDKTTHLVVATGFLVLEKELKEKQVYSAGFAKIDFVDGVSFPTVMCSGESTSIGIASHPEKDEEVILDLFTTIGAIKMKMNTNYIKELYV